MGKGDISTSGKFVESGTENFSPGYTYERDERGNLVPLPVEGTLIVT